MTPYLATLQWLCRLEYPKPVTEPHPALDSAPFPLVCEGDQMCVEQPVNVNGQEQTIVEVEPIGIAVRPLHNVRRFQN